MCAPCDSHQGDDHFFARRREQGKGVHAFDVDGDRSHHLLGRDGIPVAFISNFKFADPSTIFGIWWVTGIIGLVIALMSLGIMGLFQIKLPQKVYMVNPKADSAWGAFVFGIMTAVLGLPCFGFVAGALLAGAATMPSILVLTVFAFMGIGMAAPYVVLAMFPKLIEKLPRTGPASELIKHIMGLLMLGAAAYFLGTAVIAYGIGHDWTFPWWGKAVHWWAIGFVVSPLVSGLWCRLSRSPSGLGLG